MELKESLRTKILAANDRPNKAVVVPEWDATVYVRTMSAGERDRWEEGQLKNPYQDVRARLAAEVLVDAQGGRLFAPADVAELSSKSAKALDRVFAIAIRHNGISRDDVDELKKN